eukprot:4482421-Prorocentrum_lima.AAC.1
MTSSLVGSEMCIRDRSPPSGIQSTRKANGKKKNAPQHKAFPGKATSSAVSYTHLTLPTICSV